QKLCINEDRCILDQKTLKFSALGDWGGLPVWPYYSRAQKIVAQALGELAKSEKIDFHLSLGDHFYFVGVKDDDDSRFETTPWYMMAGNHDHLGNISAQISYTKKSGRW
uniref:Uncharacterized protein n=1 Tax=Romanomermis culicivorax TaxID=13658 RepID=A0A915KP24_ROMCU